VKPSVAPAARTGVELDGTTAGGITGPATVRQGEVVTMNVGAERAGDWVAAWMFSTPVLLNGDWTQVASDGTITFRVPADAQVGEHRIAVFAADGTLVGWSTVTVTAAGETPVGTLPATGGSVHGGFIAGGLIAAALGLGLVAAVRRRPQADL
jgi:LPXTG-motif cell wall-anchored protein